MARTKQTARKCLIQQVSRQMLQAQKVARKSQGPQIKKAKKNKKLTGRNAQHDESSSS